MSIGSLLIILFLLFSGSVVTAADQRVARKGQHWAFRTVRAPAAPRVSKLSRARTPIDAFVLARLQVSGLELSADADRQTLLRRVHLDLTGLPPTVEEIEAWRTDERPDAYERLIDRLLASPHFGERWGKHWLDVAGYVADQDKSWRYRDYVIGAMNSDKPFDRFLVEQIAGDELVDWRGAEDLSPDIQQLLVATGFFRCARDESGNIMTDIPEVRFATLFDTMEILGTGVLGLTLQCAQCHEHKFDPIPQRDYYRLMALITPAFNPQNWIWPDNRNLMDGEIIAITDVGPPMAIVHVLHGENFTS